MAHSLSPGEAPVGLNEVRAWLRLGATIDDAVLAGLLRAALSSSPQGGGIRRLGCPSAQPSKLYRCLGYRGPERWPEVASGLLGLLSPSLGVSSLDLGCASGVALFSCREFGAYQRRP